MKKGRFAKKVIWLSLGLGVVALAVGWQVKNRYVAALPLAVMPLDKPSKLASWPWKNARPQTLAGGISHWTKTDEDGTAVDLFEFDFAKNPRLSFEIFDQDENDRKPFDNSVLYWQRNVAKATKELNAGGRGPILVAWNGAFFGYNRTSGEEDAFHVSPVVLGGKVHFNTANHRWAWGVKNTPDGPVWKTFFRPSRQTLERELDWGAGSLQCLVQSGKPLKLEPFPQSPDDFKTQPVKSTPQEAGHIPYFDHMRTCRASIGWSRDSKKLYLLTVKEPDFEGGSSAALTAHVRGFDSQSVPALVGGWTVADVQRFWVSKGVWGAVNSDAGDVLQFVYRKTDNLYTFVPPRQESGLMRVNCGPNWKGAPKGGGSIMYFFVREKPQNAPKLARETQN